MIRFALLLAIVRAISACSHRSRDGIDLTLCGEVRKVCDYYNYGG